MTNDKQLRGIKMGDVLEKRRLGQALNMKEFAVLAGVSYSIAREWFQMKGFPRLEGVVFWQDFVEWRNNRYGGTALLSTPHPHADPTVANATQRFSASGMPPRAAKILLEVGK